MKTKWPSIALFFVGISFFFAANYMADSATEHDAVGVISYWAFILGGIITAALSVIMFFSSTDEYNPTINERD